MKPKHLLLMAIVGLAATSCQSGNSGSVVGSVSDESSVSSPVSTPISDSTGSDVTSSGPSSDSSSEPTSDSTSASEPTSPSISTSTSTSEPASESTSPEPAPEKTVAQAVAAGENNASLVKSGTIAITDFAGTNIEYEFGTDDYGDFLHYHLGTDWINEDYYIAKDGSGSQINIKVDSNGVSKPNTTYFSTKGYMFNNVLDYSIYHTGVEGLVSSLYSIGSANTNEDFVESSNEGAYSYGFGRGDSYSFRFVTTTFNLSSNEIFESVNVEVKQYYSSSFIMDDGTGVIELLPGAQPSSTTTFTIAQVEGTRAAINPYDVEGFFYTSFDLSDGNNTIESGSNIEIEAGYMGAITLSITNALPTTAQSAFDEIKTSVTSGEESGVSTYFNSTDGTLQITGQTVGEYTIEASTRDVSKTINVTVVPARAKSVNVTVMKRGLDNNGNVYYNSSILTGPVTLYLGNEVILNPSITPYNVVDTIEHSVVAGNVETISVIDEKITLYGMERDVKKVSATVVGSYTVRIYPTNAPTVYVDVVINVEEKPKMADFLNGMYGSKSNNALARSVTFTPDAIADGEADSLTGTAVVKISNQTENVTYVVSESATQTGAYDVTFTHVSGDNIGASMKIGPDYSLLLIDGSSNSYTLNKGTPEFIYSGSYEATHGGITYTLTLNVSGEFLINDSELTNHGYVEGRWVLTSSNNGGYTIDFQAGNSTDAEQIRIDFDDDTSYIDAEGNVYVNILINGVSQSLHFTLSTNM